MAGYDGYSMSNNAREAYEEGEMPLSKWTKTAILEALEEAIEKNEIILKCDIAKLKKEPVKILKDLCLKRSSWHHTGYHYNRTDFYFLNIDYINRLTDDIIEAEIKEAKNNKEDKRQEVSEVWKCKFLVWEGTSKHPKAIEVVEIGTIKGDWFYRPDGSKKSIKANGFYKVEKVSDVSLGKSEVIEKSNHNLTVKEYIEKYNPKTEIRVSKKKTKMITVHYSKSEVKEYVFDDIDKINTYRK